MKNRRQEKILELIAATDVDTQEALQKMLIECGFPVTQATISRDIRELKLMKTSSPNGGYHYVTPDSSTARRSLLTDTVTGVDHAMNTVVIKCHTGMAQAACAALDMMQHTDIVGTLAGDDTIFILTRTEQNAADLTEALKVMIWG